MSGGKLIGLILICVGVLDFLLGSFVIIPRAAENVRPVLRLAFVAGAALLIVLGALFLTGVLGASA